MFPALQACISVAFYEVLFLKTSRFFDWSEFCVLFLFFSFCAVEVPFDLVLWGRRTVSLKLSCCYSLRGRTCPSVVAEH